MFCSFCGKMVPGGANLCPYCGSKTGPAGQNLRNFDIYTGQKMENGIPVNDQGAEFTPAAGDFVHSQRSKGFNNEKGVSMNKKNKDEQHVRHMGAQVAGLLFSLIAFASSAILHLFCRFDNPIGLFIGGAALVLAVFSILLASGKRKRSSVSSAAKLFSIITILVSLFWIFGFLFENDILHFNVITERINSIMPFKK